MFSLTICVSLTIYVMYYNLRSTFMNGRAFESNRQFLLAVFSKAVYICFPVMNIHINLNL